ncbi:MAG: wax ester/triacylglycerol synthase family O-acyltransferase [Acidobacteriia bacterium]|nr:wax ester/triacylglycerol synthase family O-acyltransferase [Terriglobia bacterium]
MPELENNEALSFGDALFLYLERQGMPLHIASVSVFEGEVEVEAFAPFIESKLPLVPRYRQRVVTPPLNLGLPVWSYDPHFDLRNHIHQVTLKKGSSAEFKAMAGLILSETMDRQRPLWDLTLVRGLQGNRTGLITRIHHCLADGLAGIGLMNALMDASPVPPRSSRRSRPLPALPISEPPSLLDSLIRSSFSAVQQVLAAHSELLTFAQRLVTTNGKQDEYAGAGSTLSPDAQPVPSFMDELSRLLPEVAAPARRLPFNVICRGPQKFHWTEIPLAEIKAVKQACGTTVNDVALATMTLAVRRYAELHGVPLQGRTLRIVVPVSVRGKEGVEELGNRITFLPVSIPLDLPGPKPLIAAVSETMALLKGAHLAEFVGFAGSLLGAIPTALQALLGPITSQLPLSLCNLIFTNVRGPETPLYLLGHKMVACYPYVPIGGEMGMNCAVLTYDGTAYFGFTGDVHAVPDLKCFEKLLVQSFAELRKLALPVPRKKRRSPKKVAVEPASPAPTAESAVPPKPVANVVAVA